MAEKYERLKGLLDEALPLLQEFIEENPMTGEILDDMEDVFEETEQYESDPQISDGGELDEIYGDNVDKEDKENDREMRKRMSAKAISKKMEKGKGK